MGCISSTVYLCWMCCVQLTSPGFEMEDEHPSRPRVVVTVGHAIQQFRVILDELGRAPDLDAVLIGVVEAGRFREDLFIASAYSP